MSNKEDRSDIVIGARPRRGRVARFALLAALGLVLLGGSTAASYYVDALWFESLGLASVFWTRLDLRAAVFGAFALLTFLVVYGVFRALKPDRLGALMGSTILVNLRPVTLPVEPVLKLIGVGLSLFIAAVTGISMTEHWMTLALFWEAPRNATMLDPIFGRSLDFYLFTLPAACDRGSSHRLLPGDRRLALVRQRLYRRTEPAGARATLHCTQYRNDTAGLRARPRRDARISRRHWNRGGGIGQQPDDAREHQAMGLARLAGYASPDSGNPDLLRLSGYRHRSISDRRLGPPDDAGRPRTQSWKTNAQQPQTGLR